MRGSSRDQDNHNNERSEDSFWNQQKKSGNPLSLNKQSFSPFKRDSKPMPNQS